MGNFTLSEILTIAVIILIVFGPNRLPELARKAGSLMSRARGTMQTLRQEFSAEYQEVVAPMKDVRDELRAVRQDLDETVTEFAKDVKESGDVSASLQPVKDDLDATVTEISRELSDVEEAAADSTAPTNHADPEPTSDDGADATSDPSDSDTTREEATGTEGS